MGGMQGLKQEGTLGEMYIDPVVCIKVEVYTSVH